MVSAHLWLWIPSHPACESYGHSLVDLVMFQLHLEAWCHSVFHRHIPIVDFIAWIIHRRPFQPVLDFTDESLLTAGDFVFLDQTEQDLVNNLSPSWYIASRASSPLQWRLRRHWYFYHRAYNRVWAHLSCIWNRKHLEIRVYDFKIIFIQKNKVQNYEDEFLFSLGLEGQTGRKAMG